MRATRSDVRFTGVLRCPPRERLEWLREMLRMIPKQKGTERLQARHQGVHQVSRRGARRTEARRSSRWADACHSSGRCRSDCPHRATECRQVLATRAAHRIGRTRCPVRFHDAASFAWVDAVRGCALSTHRHACGTGRASAAMARQHAADGGCGAACRGSLRAGVRPATGGRTRDTSRRGHYAYPAVESV